MHLSGWRVGAFFTALTVVMTWPLVTVLPTEIAIDLGDPVFSCWVILWTGGCVLRFLKGDWTALGDFWNGNIFYPERMTIAYSEHLAPQMLQALPILAATGNVVLAYNVVFLSTFVLSGLGMFLLVRELTGRPWAALLAGTAFAFAPYRMDQLPHLQVISSQWMPFALYGFRRYFDTGRLRPLVGGAVALAAQILSCGYFLLFFVPFAGIYCGYEVISRRQWASRRIWLHLGAAWSGVAIVVAPFIRPYFIVRDITAVGVRPLDEIIGFSADASAFINAPHTLRLWGERLASFPKPEGAGFAGVTIMSFVLVAVGTAALNIRRARPESSRLLGFSLLALLASAALALGPEIQWHGQPIAPGPYVWLYRHVPGFDGVRVPARFLMITACFMAVLVGLGAAAIERWSRAGRVILAIGLLGMVAESWSVPLGSNQRLFMEHFELAPRHLADASTLGAVYDTVRDLPGSAILAEFPFGAPPFDIQTVFYAGYHRRRVINGYAGFFPPSFNARFTTLGWDPTEHREAALATLIDARVTHVVVHEAAYFEDKGAGISNWLRNSGAREIAVNGTDRLFALK